jgi:hypothetical protein
VLAVKEENRLQKLDHVPYPNFNLALRNLLLQEIAEDVLNETPLINQLAAQLEDKV